MLAAYTPLLKTIDYSLLGIGAVGFVLLPWVLRPGSISLRSAAHVPPPVGGLDVLVAVVSYLGATALAAGLIATQVSPAAASQPGTGPWHAFLWQDLVGKSFAIAVMILCLTRGLRRRFAPPPEHTPGASTAMQVGRGFLAALVFTPPVWALAYGLDQLWRYFQPDGPPDHLLLQALHHSEWGVWGQLQIGLSAVLLAGISEELFFRGVMLGALQRAFGGPWPAIVFTAVVFGLVHTQTPHAIPPLVLMGIGLGWLRVWSNSLVPSIVAHAAFNGRTIALALLAPELLNEEA